MEGSRPEDVTDGVGLDQGGGALGDECSSFGLGLGPALGDNVVRDCVLLVGGYA